MATTLKATLIGGLASFALLTGCTPTTEIAEPAIVNLQTPPKGLLPDTIAPTAYRMDLVTDPDQDSFTGRVEIDVELKAPHKRIWLHSMDHRIELAAAKLADGTEQIAVFERSDVEGGVSSLTFETPIPAGNSTLIIEYAAPYNFGLAGLYKATQAGEAYLATQMEPIDARRMVPSFDEPRFKTPWTTTVTAPASETVITNGALVSSETLDSGLVKHSFETTRPIQSYLIALAVGPYDMREGADIAANTLRDDQVPFRGFAPKGKGDQLQQAMDITDEMLDWQEAYFDYPYPYGKLDIIAVPDFAYGAMENAGAIIYRESALLVNDRTTRDRFRGIMTTHAHELGHQWFGNLVTPYWWDDIWLNEAFATWISHKTMDAVYPDTGFDLAPQRAAMGVMGSDSLLNARQIRNPIERNADILDAFDGITYRKGGGVLSMFETYVGEDAFRDGMRLHMRRFEDGVADVNDFMTSLADGSGNQDVIESFKSFIFQPGIPALDIALSCSGGQATATISQNRYAPLGSQIDRDASTWTVPFALRYSPDGLEITEQRMILSDKTTEVSLEAGCPTWIMPNAGGTGYWRFDFEDDAQWQALINNYASISEGEQLVLIDSAFAAFETGSLETSTVLDIIALTAESGEWAAASSAIRKLAKLNSMLDVDQQDALMTPFIMEVFTDRYEYLTARTAAGLSQGEVLLRDQLSSFLLEYGDLPDARTALNERARLYFGVDGDADTSRLAAEDLIPALKIALELDGENVFPAVLDHAINTPNQRERRSLLSLLASSGQDAQVLDLMERTLEAPFDGQETWSIYESALRHDTAQDATWAKYQENFAAMVERVPAIRIAYIGRVVSSFCEREKIRDVSAFFEENADLIPGYERRFAQGRETAELCTALRSEKAEDLKTALRGR